jgi:hypothetical protein
MSGKGKGGKSFPSRKLPENIDSDSEQEQIKTQPSNKNKVSLSPKKSELPEPKINPIGSPSLDSEPIKEDEKEESTSSSESEDSENKTTNLIISKEKAKNHSNQEKKHKSKKYFTKLDLFLLCVVVIPFFSLIILFPCPYFGFKNTYIVDTVSLNNVLKDFQFSEIDHVEATIYNYRSLNSTQSPCYTHINNNDKGLQGFSPNFIPLKTIVLTNKDYLNKIISKAKYNLMQIIDKEDRSNEESSILNDYSFMLEIQNYAAIYDRLRKFRKNTKNLLSIPFCLNINIQD